MDREKIVVLDFGSQYAHLIAKRFRSLSYYAEIAEPNISVSSFKNVKGIVLSGGPSSVYDSNVPDFNEDIFNLDIPILGLCYGHQLMAKVYGGKVERAERGEFGKAQLEIIDKDCPLFKNISSPMQVWESHQDEVVSLADGFEVIAKTKDCAYSALQNKRLNRYSLQFHSEVNDTPMGNTIFENFATICGLKKNWSGDDVLSEILLDIKSQAKDKKVLLFLSGGVDSSVCFALLNKALGKDKVLGLHIDNGFMRKNESTDIAKKYNEAGLSNFIAEDASKFFLDAVANITDPQEKRLMIGNTFLKVRDSVVSKLDLNENEWLLAQGTLYPDIIESGGTKNSHVIKTHHNRVEGIQNLIERGLVIEPLKNLYKDEVRLLGKKIGLPESFVMRHPFPGPGISINVLCSNGVLSYSDKTDFEKAQKEIKNFTKPEKFLSAISETLEKNTDKNFFVKSDKFNYNILPVRSVGVQGDFRTYSFPCVLYSKKEENGKYLYEDNWIFFENLSSTITNSVQSVNRVVLCLYQKKDARLSLQEAYCTKDRLDKLRIVDSIILDVLYKTNYYEKIFQHLTIMLPYSSSKETASFVLRPVCSEDVMTARFAQIAQDVLDEMILKISKLSFVDSLYFDITNKPPATFGWE